MKISNFFKSPFKAFSQYDNVRSIPSIIDGLKDSQRKCVYGMSLNGYKEIKVSQLAELSSMKTHYDHGGTSLEGAIVGLAQNYPGTNNVNVFEPIGQFGSILGPDAGAPRYIYTKPSALFSKIFRSDDDCILIHKEVDGDRTEPVVYWPTIPLWALNGVNGIGTGYKSLILPRAAKNVGKAISSILSGKPIKPAWVKPVFKGWSGEVVDDGDRWALVGSFTRVNTTTLVIDEIPAGLGIDKVKLGLIDLMDKGLVKVYNNLSTEDQIKIEVICARKLTQLGDVEILKSLNLISYVTEKFTFWDEHWNIKIFDSFIEALEYFVALKSESLVTRKAKVLELMLTDIAYMEDRVRFVEQWHKFDNVKFMSNGDIAKYMIDGGVSEVNLPSLMRLSVSSLSKDGIDELLDKIKNVQRDRTAYEMTPAADIYIKELGEL